MIGSAGEKNVYGTLAAKTNLHINGVRSVIFKDSINLINFKLTIFKLFNIGLFMKSTGRTNLHYTWETFPLIDINNKMIVKPLSFYLALTTHYEELWDELFNFEFRTDSWSKKDEHRFSRFL